MVHFILNFNLFFSAGLTSGRKCGNPQAVKIQSVQHVLVSFFVNLGLLACSVVGSTFI